MRAVLDHVGIAVSDLPRAIAFYRDALGLHVEAAEDVVSQRVRAHFIPVGEPALELLEATAPDSPIARFIEKRGPGLHHITLRVDDIHAALAAVKEKGVRLIDETPRPGAEGALVAFIHPAAAHGVLVELKQGAASSERPPLFPRSADLRVQRFDFGGLELISLYDGCFRLDGGAMFGVVPKALWGRKTASDDRNRIPLSMRPLLVRGEKTVLIDAGLGDKENEKFHEIYCVDRERHLAHALAEAGLTVDDIDIVLATHLHFDHAGGFTSRSADGRITPRFPRARYVVRRGEWEDATHPHERNRASYFAQNYVPLQEAGVLDIIDDDGVVAPGVRVERTGGHTAHHQVVWIESGSRRALYAADLIPTAAHLPEAWTLGFDLYPMDSLQAKKRVLREVLSRETLVLFEHDPAVAAGYLLERDGKRSWQSPT